MVEAAAMAEKPLLDDSGITSIDLGLCTLEFNYHYLLVILGRASDNMKSETISSSKRMLYLLQHLVSDSEEVYNGIVWQLVCCPFTPFLALFGELLASTGATTEEDEEALSAMKELPLFLKKMSLRNSLAARLQGIAVVFVQHAESVVRSALGRRRWDAPSSHRLAELIMHDRSAVRPRYTADSVASRSV